MSEPAPISLNQNQFVVLREYSEMGNEYLNNDRLAEKIGCHVGSLRSTISELKEMGLLIGDKKIGMTPQGAEIYHQAVEVLRQRAMSSAADPSAAVTQQPPTNQPAPLPHRDDPAKLSEIVAQSFNVDPGKLWNVIKRNVITGENVTDEEVMQVLSVMHKYQLDPFVKQVYAFRHRQKLQIHVAIDGWIAIANRNPNFQGVEYEFPSEMVDAPSGGRKCWPWVKAICHVRGRKPTVVYAFLEEWFVGNSDNWKERPAYRLQKKAYTMSVREGLGIALYDDMDRDVIEQDFHKIAPVTHGAGRIEGTVGLLDEIERVGMETSGDPMDYISQLDKEFDSQGQEETQEEQQ